MEFTQVEIIQDKALQADEVTICPIGDLQYGAPGCNMDRFRDHIEWSQAQPNPLYIGMGDLVDFGSPSNRAILQSLIAKGSLYDSARDALDYAAEKHLEEVMKVLEPTKGQWLGMLEGHHLWQFPDGTTSDIRLCQELGTEFLGTCAIVRLSFVSKNKQAEGHLSIWAHHGRGSGAFLSSPLNKLEKLAAAWEDIDIFLMAHHHKTVTGKMIKLRPLFPSRQSAVGARLKEREVHIVGTGGFMRGYVENYKKDNRAAGTYVEDGMMGPLPLGAPIIQVRVTHPRQDRTKITTHIIT